ncbi:kinase-like domain-containing protein [Gorgonomyces haynaldii]|nr:kinase-like domain-containing protein [Gorgonomyces haynaldii]
MVAPDQKIQSPDTDSNWPELVGYKFLKVQGQGSFATVYLALLDGEKVAVKAVDVNDTFKLSLLNQEKQVYQLLATKDLELEPLTKELQDQQEGRTNVVSYIDFIKTPTHACLVLEYFEGAELYDIIMDQFVTVGDAVLGIHEENAKIIILGILKALYYLHKKGIAHCDLKLENILCQPDFHIKIIDFGLAHKVEPNESASTPKGSEPYLSPETIMRTQTDALKSDIWALGVIAFAILTSRMPFDGNPEALRHGGSASNLVRTRTMLRRIASASYSFSEKEIQVLSPEARDVVSQMLTRNAANRPTAYELLKHPWFENVQSPVTKERRSSDWARDAVLALSQKLEHTR